MYLAPTKNHFACDIEADNLLDKATRIWCCVVVNLVTKVEHTFTSREEFTAWRRDNPKAIFVGHNFLSYDMPMLNKFWGAEISERKVVDTFVLSQLYSPTFKGGHSLEAWGQRLRYPKGDFDDFSRLSPEMLRYCRRDTLLVGLLFVRLTERMRSVGFVEDGCRLEHLAWHIIQNKQRRNGFPFNYKKATALYAELRAREEELKNEIYRLWPPRRQAVKTFAQGRKKNGERTTGYLRHLEQYPELRDNPDGSYTAYDDVCFNLGSPPQRIEKLLELGWKPVNKTKAGNPKVDEDELLAFAEVSGKSELKALAKWIVVNSRANMVNTWLEAYNEETGCIHGRLFLASTMRYRHSNPNSANIPSVRLDKEDNILYGEEGAWTYECRDLWWAGEDEDFVLVGIDGTGIQNRCLIHSCIDTVGEDEVAPFKELSLHGDIHKRNIETLGLANKPAAKKAYYTIMMGGGGGRIAADQAQFGTKLTAKEGEALRQGIIANIPGFKETIERLQEELNETGRIKLCSGTPILVPSPHMVIPYRLQGDESQLMKLALIFVDKIVTERGWENDAFKVADIHDEWQWRVRKSIVKEFIEAALPCFVKAGEFFNYNIEITGDAKEGRTWAETH